MTEMPLVSIIIACRNEEKFISSCLDSILENSYPKDLLEILVCDGRSEDRTRSIINDYEKKYSSVKLVDNPKKITTCAFNAGVNNATGQVVMIMGAHAKYPRDYIYKCVTRLFEHQAWNVGGVLRTEPQTENLLGETIVATLASPFGVGNARFRTGANEPIEVDTVFGGCYPRSVFDTLGLFNEELKLSQDIEFNLRLKKAGKKTLLFPDIEVVYYARSTLGPFLKHNFRNGFWSIFPFNFTSELPITWRHLIPMFFVLSLVVPAILGFFVSPGFYVLTILSLVSYFACAVFFSLKMAKQKQKWQLALTLPVTFFLLHAAYGVGSIVCIGRLFFSKRFWEHRLIKKDFEGMSAK